MILSNDKCNNLVILSGDVTYLERSPLNNNKYQDCIGLRLNSWTEYQCLFPEGKTFGKDLVGERIRIKGQLKSDKHGDMLILCDAFEYITSQNKRRVG